MGIIEKTLLVLFLIIGYITYNAKSYAQDFCKPEFSKKSENLLNIADSLYAIGSSKAISYYKKALDADTLNIKARFQLANLYFDKQIVSKYDILLASYNNFYSHKAEEYLLKCIEQCKSYKNYASFYFLGSLYFYKEEYNLAGYFLKEYLQNTNNKKFGYKQANQYYSKYLQWKKWNNNPTPVTPFPLSELNTNGDEDAPNISHDGQILFYTRRYLKPIKNTLFSEIAVDPFYSYVIGIDSMNNWVFSKGEIAFKIENKTIESFSLSSDKNTVYLTACENIRLEKKVVKDCDIYTSQYNGNGWDDPIPIEAEINRKNTFEGFPCISAKGDKLYFSSNGFNGFGGKDLFYCIKDNSNNWSRPINMGKEINTLNDEIAPFLSYDNKTMYFASNGHFGLGGFDVFYVYHDEELWGKPQNIGMPYNNGEDNMFFNTDARGLSGYYASKEDFTYGGSDILAVPINNRFRTKPKMIINIKVNTPEDFEVAIPSLSIQDVFNDQNIPLVRSNNQDYYSAIVDIDESIFILRLNTPNCIYTNKIIQTNSNYSVFESIDVKPIKKGVYFTIEDLKLTKNSTVFSKYERIILNDFSNYLRLNNIQIKIIGYYYSLTYGEDDKEKAINLVKKIENELLRNGVNNKQLHSETIDLYVDNAAKDKDKHKIKQKPEILFEIIGE